MGRWTFEVAKMFMYLGFPVVCFLTFNNPLFYENALQKALEKDMKHINLETLIKLQESTEESQQESLDKLIKEIEKQ